MNHTWMVGNLLLDIVNKRTNFPTPRSGAVLYLKSDTRPYSDKGLFIFSTDKRNYWQQLTLTDEIVATINSPQETNLDTLTEYKDTILQHLNQAPKLAILFATITDNDVLVKAFGLKNSRIRTTWPDVEFVKFQRDTTPLETLKSSGMTAGIFQKLMDKHIVKTV